MDPSEARKSREIRTIVNKRSQTNGRQVEVGMGMNWPQTKSIAWDMKFEKREILDSRKIKTNLKNERSAKL